MLPAAVKGKAVRTHKKVKALYEKDIAAGHGAVYLPNAFDRKYPNAAKEWAWQYAFLAANLSVDPRINVVRRRHISDTALKSAAKTLCARQVL